MKYLNAQPLVHGWSGPVEFDHPAALCRRLAAGELDAALVSSFEFLRNPIYHIVDDVAIAAEGAVYSVFVAYRGALDDVARVEVDPASATSVNLLRCLRPQLTTQTEESDARLLIGDQAIRFRQAAEESYRFWDLAEEWQQQFALPFVFALWLIRPEVQEVAALAQALRSCRDTNLQRLDEIAAAQKDFAPDFASRYFREHLRFHFGPREKQGLLHFRSLCQSHGILPAAENAGLKLI